MTTAPATLELQRHFLGDLLGAKRAAALERVMDAYRNGCQIQDIYRDVFQEALYEIGRLWETNRISVAEEHMSTAITQYIMSNLYQHLEMSGIQRGRLVMTGVQGELHQVGANMVSDVLEADGWDVMFLGANVPPEDVIAAIRQHHADLLGISVTLFPNLASAAKLVGMVHEEFGADAPRILLGGGAFNGIEEPPPGLEGCLIAHDLREALELARNMTGTGSNI